MYAEYLAHSAECLQRAQLFQKRHTSARQQSGLNTSQRRALKHFRVQIRCDIFSEISMSFKRNIYKWKLRIEITSHSHSLVLLVHKNYILCGLFNSYTHNFIFRCDIICPVSFAIFLCFSLLMHGIVLAGNKGIHSVSFPPSMADKCVASQCRAMVERSKEK